MTTYREVRDFWNAAFEAKLSDEYMQRLNAKMQEILNALSEERGIIPNNQNYKFGDEVELGVKSKAKFESTIIFHEHRGA